MERGDMTYLIPIDTVIIGHGSLLDVVRASFTSASQTRDLYASPLIHDTIFHVPVEFRQPHDRIDRDKSFYILLYSPDIPFSSTVFKEFSQLRSETISMKNKPVAVICITGQHKSTFEEDVWRKELKDAEPIFFKSVGLEEVSSDGLPFQEIARFVYFRSQGLSEIDDHALFHFLREKYCRLVTLALSLLTMSVSIFLAARSAKEKCLQVTTIFPVFFACLAFGLLLWSSLDRRRVSWSLTFMAIDFLLLISYLGLLGFFRH